MPRTTPIAIALILTVLISSIGKGAPCPAPSDSTLIRQQEALHYLDTALIPEASPFWPHVKGYLFVANLRNNIQHPLSLYQGTNTNFCGYAALSYLVLRDAPLQYVQFLITLYRSGNADWGKQTFTPSPEVRNAAGTLHFKGVLDIRPADQIWFLSLAGHFRSYLNFFFHKFREGSEDTFWAACNYGKFNRMIRTLLGYSVNATGSDLVRPHFKDLYEYLSNSIRNGTTWLYVNNTYLHIKKHDKSKFSFPTHFLVLTEIRKTKDVYTIVYWDYGGRTLREVTPGFLRKIIFGVTTARPKDHDQ